MNNSDDDYGGPKTKMELIMELANLVSQLGWVIALPTEEPVDGLVVGTKEYVTDVSNAYYGKDNIDILENTPDSGFEVGPEVEESVEIIDIEKKKPLLH